MFFLSVKLLSTRFIQLDQLPIVSHLGLLNIHLVSVPQGSGASCP